MVRTRRTSLIAVFLVVLVVRVPILVHAVSSDPLPRPEERPAREIVPGGMVFLFHSGTEEVRRSLKVGDALGVSHTGPDGKIRPAGTIRATAFVSECCRR